VLATTKPLATYFFTVCAGPYVSVTAVHDGIPLGIHARASLREPLERQGEQMLAITARSFDSTTRCLASVTRSGSTTRFMSRVQRRRDGESWLRNAA